MKKKLVKTKTRRTKEESDPLDLNLKKVFFKNKNKLKHLI